MKPLSDIGLVDIDESRVIQNMEEQFKQCSVRSERGDFLYRSPDGHSAVRVPSPERYTTKDWVHNLKTLPNSAVLK